MFKNILPYILQTPREEMSGVHIQLSGDTLYMSSTLVKGMLFIPLKFHFSWSLKIVCVNHQQAYSYLIKITHD